MPAMTDPNQSPAGAGPSWKPPRSRDGNIASIIVGLALLAIGGWYLLDQTFNVDMPRINWRDVWPVILIVLGAFVIFQSIRRRA
jgi:uncharacterized integral membrane protein